MEFQILDVKSHQCFSYFPLEGKWCLDVVKERKRFGSVQKFIESLDSIAENDFYDCFSEKVFIWSENLNDAICSCAAIVCALQDKFLSEDNKYEYEYCVSHNDIFNTTVLASGLPVNIPVDDDDFNLDEFSILLDNQKCQFSVVTSPVSVENFDFGDKKNGKLVFILYQKLNFFDEENDSEKKRREEIAEFKRVCDMNGINFLEIKTDSTKDLLKMLIEKMTEKAFTVQPSAQKFLQTYLLENSERFKTEIQIDGLAIAIQNYFLFHSKENSDRIISKSLLQKMLGDVKKEAVESSPKESQRKKIIAPKIIGLEDVQKKLLDAIVSSFVLEKKRRDMGISTLCTGMNIALAGPPGTAKTTLARVFADKLEREGIIPPNSFMEVHKSDLQGKYLGFSADNVDQLFKKTYYNGGGVLFIDEAYQFCGASGEQSSYEFEIMNCLVENMERYREKVFVIFAGYEREIEELLQKNAGLKSRINFVVKFNGYNNETLCKITNELARQAGYVLPDESDIRPILEDFFDRLRQIRGDQFGNGREARNLISGACNQVAIRLQNQKRLSRKMLTTMTIDDISKAAEDILNSELNLNNKNQNNFKIGF